MHVFFNILHKMKVVFSLISVIIHDNWYSAFCALRQGGLRMDIRNLPYLYCSNFKDACYISILFYDNIENNILTCICMHENV